MVTKLHSGLVWAIFFSSVPLLGWSLYVLFETVPVLDVTLNWISEIAESDVIMVAKKETLEQEETFKDLRHDLRNVAVCGLLMVFLLLLRSTVLILIISGKDEFNINQCFHKVFF